ncbi:hypothetical protein GCM10022285_15130 [Streptomyces tunisiensis]|uniref:Uncharacterized protein n=1 Tax=Streptomyces tunisiensis TaxID=948699 RepID=A0ABP7XZV0_9ACTN
MPAPCPSVSVVSQATGSSGCPATQSATSSVFPAPAEPFTMVRGVRRAPSRCPASRSLRRKVSGGAGTAKRVLRNGSPWGSWRAVCGS